MAYNLLKMHRKALMRLGMDDILQYLQVFLFYLIIFIKKHLSHYSLQSSTLQMNFQKKIIHYSIELIKMPINKLFNELGIFISMF